MGKLSATVCFRADLSIRVLLVSLISLALSFAIIDWLDHTKPDIPKWMQTVAFGLLLLPFFAFMGLTYKGVTDIAVHFLPEGKFKRLMVGKEKTSVELAEEFGKEAYLRALLPLYVWDALLALLLVVLLAYGGFALVSSMLSAAFGGWPTWAIVITILLVLILLKPSSH